MKSKMTGLVATLVLLVGAHSDAAQKQLRSPSAAGQAISSSAVGADKDNWRYQWYGGRWWYWLSENRWTYYEHGRWNDYSPIFSVASRADNASGVSTHHQANSGPSVDAGAAVPTGGDSSRCPSGARVSYGGFGSQGPYGQVTPWGTSGVGQGGGVVVPGWGR